MLRGLIWSGINITLHVIWEYPDWFVSQCFPTFSHVLEYIEDDNVGVAPRVNVYEAAQGLGHQ